MNGGIDGPAAMASPHIYDMVAAAEHQHKNDAQYSQIRRVSTSSENSKNSKAQEPVKPQIPVKPIFLTQEQSSMDGQKPETRIGVVQPNCHLACDTTEDFSTIYEDIEKYCRGYDDDFNEPVYDDVENVLSEPRARGTYIEIQSDSDFWRLNC